MLHKHAFQGDPEASNVEEGLVGGEQMLMTDEQAAESTEPGIGSLHDPSPPAAPHLASNFITAQLVVLAIGRDQSDRRFLQQLADRNHNLHRRLWA